MRLLNTKWLVLFDVELSPVRQAGYDAIRETPVGPERLQIKGRCLLPGAKRSQQIGGIKLDNEWDFVLLVLLDETFEATAIYEADRPAVEAALLAPGSKARNERGGREVRSEVLVLLSQTDEAVRKDESLTQTERQELLADLDSARTQLEKREPNKKAALAVLEPLAKISTIASPILKIVDLLT